MTTTALDNLVLHLRLDTVTDQTTVLDLSELQNDATVNGDPSLVADDTFGSCLKFDGDYLEVDDPFVDPATFTISLWVRPQAINDGSYHGFIGKHGDAYRKPGMWLAPTNGGLHYDSYDAAGARFSGILTNFFTTADEWIHVAWVKDGTAYRFYRNGVLFASKSAPNTVYRADTPYWIGRIDNYWKGSLANTRVYSRALTADEILQDVEADPIALAAFRSYYPLDCSLRDDDGQAVLYIDEETSGHALTLVVENTARQTLEFVAPANQTASADNYHIEIRFRPGVLLESALAALSVSSAGWRLSTAHRADGTMSVYLLNTTGLSLFPTASTSIVVDHMRADGTGGARNTQVAYAYQQLRYSGATALLTGTRSEQLSIINRTGAKTVPLHAGFVGLNTVLNDGTTVNTLVVRLTNTLSDRALSFNTTSGDTPTRFVLSFDAQADGEQHDWALATSSQVAAIAINLPNWQVTQDTQGSNAAWICETTSQSDLAAGSALQFTISNIVTALPSGHANLYLRYENIPGYWDDQLICTIEKSPLIVADQRVGIGTLAPRTALDTGTGLLSGAANDYIQAQWTLSGGGTVTWGGPGQRLKWTKRLIATGMERTATFSEGHVEINQPTSDIPAANVYDGSARSATADGVLLKAWEALYAVHTVGGNKSALAFYITRWNQATTFHAPSNWILVAVVNDDDKTIKLGTGMVVSAKSTAVWGSPIPTGTIVMWSGAADTIPAGWVLCDGNNGTPNLSDRFVVGAGKVSPANTKGDPTKLEGSFTTSAAGEHDHGPPEPWYDRRAMHDVAAAGIERFNAIDRGSPSVDSVRTTRDGKHEHVVKIGFTTEIRPRWYAICFIMKI